jgi:hypothetical protein
MNRAKWIWKHGEFCEKEEEEEEEEEEEDYKCIVCVSLHKFVPSKFWRSFLNFGGAFDFPCFAITGSIEIILQAVFDRSSARLRSRCAGLIVSWS